MDIDTDKPSAPINKATNNIKKPSPNASTTVSSSSHSPKPARSKETQVAISSGSGLLSGSIFGGGIDNTGPEKTAPTVVLNVPLTGDNQYVNFTRLAEERYGFNALHPRLAAQRERLARVAAAGAALESANKIGGNSGSGDEMSVDLSDAEADNSNVEMGGVNDGERIPKSGEETGEANVVKKPKKRTMKEDMYDKEDDFIDDTEMIWEEQAAASKDGFFVYSGPLVPPGQEPQVERYVPTLYPSMDHVLADLVQSGWPVKTQPWCCKRASRSDERRIQSGCDPQRRTKSASEKATRDQSGQGANGERESSEREQPGRPRVEACAHTLSGLRKSTSYLTSFWYGLFAISVAIYARASTYYVAIEVRLLSRMVFSVQKSGRWPDGAPPAVSRWLTHRSASFRTHRSLVRFIWMRFLFLPPPRVVS